MTINHLKSVMMYTVMYDVSVYTEDITLNKVL
jgi:hypothetical protein